MVFAGSHRPEGEEGGRGRSVDVSAHGQVDEHEHVELDEYGEAEENGVEKQADYPQSPVQDPFVQVDTENLRSNETIH